MKRSFVFCFLLFFLFLPLTLYGYPDKVDLFNKIKALEEHLEKAQMTEGPSCTPEELAAAQACLARAIEEYKEKDYWETEDILVQCKEKTTRLWDNIIACRNDMDRDGVSDLNDKCLSDPEIYNDYLDEDGCPDEKPKRALLTLDKIEILETIQFDPDTQALLVESQALLAEIAKIMKENPEITISIESHLDSHFSSQEALSLTEIRAEYVKSALISLGISGKRLYTKGKGNKEPIVSNSTQWGKSLNERIEFIRIQ